MARGTLLTENEKGKIDAFTLENISISEISKRLGRSRKVIYNYLANRDQYGKNKSSGPKQKLNERERRLIINKASNSTTSCASLANLVDNKVHRQTVWKVLKESNIISRQKMRQAPHQTEQHKQKRLDFAKKNMDMNWFKIIFSDEKKWNLDGPDGCHGYWRDLRKDPEIFSKRNFGGGSLMTWGAFAADGVLEMQITSTKMNSADYISVLQCSLLPYLRQSNAELWFQHDNAPIHTSRATKQFLHENSITVLEWPACSPDLNPIENVWGILARRVYKNNRQFENMEELKRTIFEEWENISLELIKSLYDSMKNRIFECIVKQGGPTHY